MSVVPISSRRLYRAYKVWRSLTPDKRYSDFDRFLVYQYSIGLSFEHLEQCFHGWQERHPVPDTDEWVNERIADYERAHPSLWSQAKSLMKWMVR